MVKTKYKVGDIIFFNWNNSVEGDWNTGKTVRAAIRGAQFIDIITENIYKWDTVTMMSITNILNKFKYAATVSKWTHVGVISKVNEDTFEVCEALSEGFVKSEYKITSVDELINYKTILIMRPSVKTKAINKNSLKYIGTPYGWVDLVKTALGLVLKLIPFVKVINDKVLRYIPFIKKIISVSSDKRLICSEAIARILYDSSDKQINIAQEMNKTYDTLTVSDVLTSKYLVTIK